MDSNHPKNKRASKAKDIAKVLIIDSSFSERFERLSVTAENSPHEISPDESSSSEFEIWPAIKGLTQTRNVRPEQGNKFMSQLKNALVVSRGSWQESYVLAGTFHQSSARISAGSRGKQCAAIACAAIAYIFDLSTQYMSIDVEYFDINRIVYIGDHLYNASINEMKRKLPNQSIPANLNVEDVHRKVQIDSKCCKIVDSNFDRKHIARGMCTYDEINGELN